MNKQKKNVNLVTFILLFLSVLCINVQETNASTSTVEKMYDNGTSIMYNRYEAKWNNYMYEQMELIRVDGKAAYCIEPGIHAENNYVYPTSSTNWNVTGINAEKKNRITLIAHYGYDYPGHNDIRYYLAAQGLIWDELVNPPSGWQVYYQYLNTGATIDTTTQKAEIENLIAKHETRPSFNQTRHDLTLGASKTLTDTNGVLNRYEVASCTNCSATISGNNLVLTSTGIGNMSLRLTSKKAYTNDIQYFVSGTMQNLILPGNVDPLIVTVSGTSSGGKFKMQKTNSKTGAGVANAEYEVYNSSKVKVCTIKTDSNGNGECNNLDSGNYTVKETKAPLGMTLDTTVYSFTLSSEKPEYTLKTTDKPAVFKMRKIDSKTKRPVAGVEYKVYDSNNKVVCTIVTDNKGEGQCTNLTSGNYSIMESKTIDGYTLDTVRHTFSLSDTNPEYTLDTVDKPALFKVKKLSSKDSKPVAGVEYKIYDSSKKVVCTIVTDSNGNGQCTNLKSGTYTIKESKTVPGYTLDTKTYTFTLSDQTPEYTLELKNKPALFKMKKVDTDSKKPVKGAEYTVYDSNNNSVCVIITDANGNGQCTNLQSGNYYVKETNSPENYLIDTTIYRFTLSDSNPEYILNVSDRKKYGKVKLYKVDSETKTQSQGDGTLGGAVYKIFDNENHLIATLTTDKNGYAESDWIEFGHYYIKEDSPSIGYKLNLEKHNFFISEDKEIITYTSYEEPYRFDLKLHKIMSDGSTGVTTTEPNAEFEIYLESTNQKVANMITDENGFAKINLPYGTYLVKQIKGMSGHHMANTFKIVLKEKDISVTVNNGDKTAKLKVVKIDAETQKIIPIKGVTFKIKNIETNEYVCQKLTYPNVVTICEFETNENGEFITPYELESGKYQLEEVDKTLEKYLWNSNPVKFEIGDNMIVENDDTYGKIVKIFFENIPVKGSFEISKTGETIEFNNNTFIYKRIPLQGVEIGVYAREDIIDGTGDIIYSKGSLVDVITTDKDGNGKLDNLYLGKYYFKELKTFDTHVLDEKEYDFELEYLDQYTPVIEYKTELHNYYKKGGLEFSKIDFSDSKPLSNTKIQIFTIDDKLIFEGHTNENGQIKIPELFIGKFYLLESEAPEGYLINEEKMYFEIKVNGEIVKTTMKDKKITGTLEFTKQDFSTDETLPNTKIQIFTEKDELVYEGVTDKDGKIVIKEIPYGKYYILESEAPEGYLLNEEKMYFEIKEDGKVIKSVMKDKKITGQLVFYKKDNHDKFLAGVVIAIYSEDGNEIGKFTTDKNGMIFVDNLLLGSYVIKEISTIDGYVLSDEKISFSIDKDNTKKTVTMINEELPQTGLNDYTKTLGIILVVSGITLVVIPSYKKRKNNNDNRL